MNSTPWIADRPLDEATVRAALKTQFPSLDPLSVRPFAEGWDSEGWLVNDDLLFLFPKRKQVVPQFLYGLDLLPILAEALPVAVPRIEYRGNPSDAFPYPFAGYPLIGGVTGDAIQPVPGAWPGLAKTLGATLTALHALPTGPFRSCDESPSAFRIPGAWAERVRVALGADLDERMDRILRGGGPLLPPSLLPPVPIHADLLDYHLVLDPSGTEIRGIIDWTDAQVGDPVGDFVGLHLWLGPRFVDLVLDEYGGPVDDGFRDRLRIRGRQVALLEFGAGLDPTSNQNVEATRIWVENAF